MKTRHATTDDARAELARRGYMPLVMNPESEENVQLWGRPKDPKVKAIGTHRTRGTVHIVDYHVNGSVVDLTEDAPDAPLCTWCGKPCEDGGVKNRAGEVFCGRSHRICKARAVKKGAS